MKLILYFNDISIATLPYLGMFSLIEASNALRGATYFPCMINGRFKYPRLYEATRYERSRRNPNYRIPTIFSFVLMRKTVKQMICIV